LHIRPYDPPSQQRLQMIQKALNPQVGSVLAGQQAYVIIYRMLVRQANLMSYIDNFHLYSYLCILSAALVFLFKRVKTRGGSVAMH